MAALRSSSSSSILASKRSVVGLPILRVVKQGLLLLFAIGLLVSPSHGFAVGTTSLGSSSLASSTTAWLVGRTSSSSSQSQQKHIRSSLKTQLEEGPKGFGAGSTPPRKKADKKKKKIKKGRKQQSQTANADNSSKQQQQQRPFVKSEQEDLIAQLQQSTSQSSLGRAVASSPLAGTPDADPFWEFMPSLIASRFPQAAEEDLQRIAGFVRHAVNKANDDKIQLQDVVPNDEEIFQNKWRPAEEIHAYMPDLGPTQPFHDPQQLELCQLMSDNFETIRDEYHALLEDNMKNGNTGKDRFQSVTSMNYKSGWKTMVLFYNGHRIPGFPYHLCPTTTRILESVPLAGRIAGFNRQQPLTGIPLHTDGNNMWLTCQMGIHVPNGDKKSAYIQVGPEKRYWAEGECLLYDTTYVHETMNEHASQERVVLHVDFFNTLRMTPLEIEVMQYIYSLREEFMKAEGVAKVGAQIL